MSTGKRSASPAATRAAAIVEFLAGEGLDYELIEHEPTMSAGAEAGTTHHPLDQVAKTIVLHDGSAYVIAAIPASERLDLHKLRELLGASRRLRLAGEDEIAREFPSLEVGAVPPFGPMVPAARGDRSCAARFAEDPVSGRRSPSLGARRPTRCGAGHRRADRGYLPGLDRR